MLSKQEIAKMTEKALKNGWKPGDNEAQAKAMNERMKNDPESLERARMYLEMSAEPKISNQEPPLEKMSEAGKAALKE